jgi:hypothetical protein
MAMIVAAATLLLTSDFFSMCDASPCGTRLTNRLHLLRRNRSAKGASRSQQK